MKEKFTPSKQKLEKKNLKIFYALAGLILILIIILPTKSEPYTVQIPYEETEPYNEQVPYSDQDCSYHDYDVKGGYLFTNLEGQESKSDWGVLWGLSYADGKPNLDTQIKYYITNYESRLGNFEIQINFVDNNNDYLESFTYDTVSVGPKETETGYIYFSALWNKKPGKASGYYVTLEKPTIEDCNTVTKYRTENKYRTVTKYRDETRYRKVNWIFG